MTDNLLSGGIAMDRLRDHYKHCIRLSASNKINPKNAFDLQLIDIMQDLVSISDDGQMNFKIASSALDVGAKIYSNRVDRIQSEAQKVASSILSALDGQTSNENADDSFQDGNTSAGSDRMNSSNNEDGKANAKKKRPNRNKNVKTVEKDENLSETKIEKMIVGDVFFDNLSQDYDMSCPAALIDYNPLTQQSCLLTIESRNLRKNYSEFNTASSSSPAPSKCNLSTVQEEESSQNKTVCENDESKENETDQDGDTIMEDVQEVGEAPEKPSHPQQSTINVNLLSVSNNSKDYHNLVTLMAKNTNCAKIIRTYMNEHISPRLENFLFNDRSTTIAGLNNQLDESKLVNEPQQNLNISSNMTMGGAHQFIPETYENNNNDDFGDDHFADAESHFGDQNERNENDCIPDLNKIAAAKPTEYGYSTEQHRLLNAWAGPHNWKAMRAPLTVKKDGAPKSVRKRAKLELSPIRFGDEFDKDLQTLANKDIRFTADAIKRWKKPLLPQDHNLDEDAIPATLKFTFLRPERTYHWLKTPADAARIVNGDHDYTREGTPGSPGQGGFDVHDDSDEEFWSDAAAEGNEVSIYGPQINDTLVQQDDLEFAGENLIEQPYEVAHINIPFAKAAKKMDVRKLKRVMWDLLFPPEKRLDTTVVENGNRNKSIENGNLTVTSGGDDHNETVIMKENNNVDTNEENDGSKHDDPSPAPSESAVHLEFSSLYGELPVRVSTKMADDLSQPIAFVTLLHLANEKNLKLIPKEDLRDFIIEQD